MFRNKFNPTIIAVVLIALLCFFLPDIRAQEQWGINGESDSTVIGYILVRGHRYETRYNFDPENYQKAIYTIQLSQIPFDGLNDKAQKVYLEGLKYIKKMEALPEIKQKKKGKK